MHRFADECLNASHKSQFQPVSTDIGCKCFLPKQETRRRISRAWLLVPSNYNSIPVGLNLIVRCDTKSTDWRLFASNVISIFFMINLRLCDCCVICIFVALWGAKTIHDSTREIVDRRLADQRQRKAQRRCHQSVAGKLEHLPVAALWQTVSVMSCHYTKNRTAAPSAVHN